MAEVKLSHCNKCDGYFPRTEEFFVFTKGKFTGGYCRPCVKKYKKEIQFRANATRQEQIKSDPEMLAYIRERDRNWRRNNPALHLFSAAKCRAKRLKLEFSIELSDIIIPDKCPLLGTPFIPGTKDNYIYSYSLDRVNPHKGYIKGNVRVISSLANTMKNRATKEELLLFAENIKKYLDT